jgi:hypothetical protein
MVAATLLTGLLEIGLGVILVVVGFARYRQARYLEVIAPVGDRPALMVLGMSLYLGFFFSAWGAAAAWCVGEGLIRSVGAVITDEPLGIVGLWVIDRVIGRVIALARALVRRSVARHAPPAAPDVLRKEGEAYVLHTDVARDWDALTTVWIEGRALRFAPAPDGDRTRRCAYRLEPTPPGWIIRRSVELGPDRR